MFNPGIGYQTVCFYCHQPTTYRLVPFFLAQFFLGLVLGLPSLAAAEFLVDNQLQSAEPVAPAPDVLSFDGYVGQPALRSILEPIPERDDDQTEWSTVRSSVAVVEDLKDPQSEWSTSSPVTDPSSVPLLANAWQHSWIPDSLTSSWSSDFGHFCKTCFRCRDACWTGRVDGVLMWRTSPYSRTLITENGAPVFNANQFESELAAGPRFQLFRTNSCGAAIEIGYLRAFNFRSETVISAATATLRPFGIFPPPTSGPFFNNGTLNLGSGIQTLELNSRTPMGSGNIQFISGFRWLEWRESFSLSTSVPSGTTTFIDNYATDVINSLYGGQIGIDALLYSSNWLRAEGLIKGGAYYNNTASHSSYQTNDPGSTNASWDVNAAPSSGAFVGELGFTGIVPLTNCLDFRFGYVGFWLESIAQPTEQLSAPDAVVSNGGTIVQGVSLGLEGRW